MTSPAIEDYLKTLYALERTGEGVSTSALAGRLRIQPASVTGMLKRLANMALVAYTPYSATTLTADGRRAALSVIRRHRLIERFLVDTLSLPWDEVHDEAHKLEHALSSKLVDRIEIFLEYPATCPHGSPIPTAEGEVVESEQILLADLPAEQSAIVSEVDDEDAAFLRYASAWGLVPGAGIEVVDVAPFQGPITFRAAGRMRSAGSEVTRRVWVRPMPATEEPE